MPPRFEIIETPIKGLKIIQRKKIEDSRGYLSRFFCMEELEHAGWKKPVAQINLTLTKRAGAIRGMHLQIDKYSEMKFVSCLAGEIWDVAIDLRKNSNTFLQSFGVNLSCQNFKSLLIPEGCAHGFQALKDDCQLLYLHSEQYMPQSEFGVHPCDPILDIKWPLKITEMSPKDESRQFINKKFRGIDDEM